MKLGRLELVKFKIFEREELTFAPITLLTGPNSSGKTSILQAICAIAQGRDDREGFPYDFRLNGPLTRLGDFHNVIHGHGSKGSFSLELEFSGDKSENYIARGSYRKAEEGGAVATRSITVKDPRASVEVSWNQRKHAYFLEYQPGEEPSSTEAAFEFFVPSDFDPDAFRTLFHSMPQNVPKTRTTDSVLQEAAKSTQLDVEKIKEFWAQQVEELKKGKIKLSAEKLADAVAEARQLRPVGYILNRSRQQLARALRQVAYVGAIRALPLRYYAVATAPQGFDPYGEGISLKLAQWKEGNKDRFNAVKDALTQLELATELKAETHLGEFVQVRIAPMHRSYMDTVADVGFGVSQVLPMVVADVGLAADGVLLINQPEVHLHPSSQALLGNYFADRVGRRQYLIETHSEYLITRLRILVGKKKLKPEQVCIYFVMSTPSRDGSLLRRIQLDENGGLIDPPKEFFRTYISDSFDLALGAFPPESE